MGFSPVDNLHFPQLYLRLRLIIHNRYSWSCATKKIRYEILDISTWKIVDFDISTWKIVDFGYFNLENCRFWIFQLGKLQVLDISAWKIVDFGYFNLENCRFWIFQLGKLKILIFQLGKL